MHKNLFIGMGFATVAAVIWSLTLAGSVLLPPGFPTVETVWGRYGVQILLIAVLVMPFRGTAVVRTSRLGLQILRGSMMVLMPVAFTLATRRIGPAEAWAAVWIAPLAGVALGSWVLGERVTRSAWILAAMATAGAVIAHQPNAAASLLGLIAAGASGVAFGAFLTLTRALKHDPPSTGLFWTAVCVFVPASLVVGGSWHPLTLRAIAALVVMGGLWMLVLLAIDEALRRAPLAVVAPFLLTEIIWTRLLFNVPWTGRGIVGAGAVLIAASICIWNARRPSVHAPAMGVVNA